MARHLIVSEAFGDYAKGDRITDAKTIDEILGSPSAGSVLPINVDDAPASGKPAGGKPSSGDPG